jgi:uncharacterized membrane protein
MIFLQKYWAELSVAFLTITTFLAHLYNISFQCLQIDEQYTAMVVTNHTLPYVIKYAITQDCNPPLYYMAAWFSSQIFNEVSPLSLRFPAIIFCALLIPVYYFIGKELHSKLAGILTGAATICMFPYWYYAQDARAYTLVLLLFGCFVYYYIKLYRGDKTRWIIFAGSLFAALCLYAHYYSIVPILILFGILIIKDKAIGLIEFIQMAILTVPLIWSLQWIPQRPLAAFGVYAFTPDKLLLYTPYELLGMSIVIFIPLIIYAYARSKDRLVNVFILAAAISWLSTIPLGQLTLIAPRYILLLSPLLVLCAMIPVAQFIEKRKTVAQKIVIAGGLLFFILTLNCAAIMTWLTFSYCDYII